MSGDTVARLRECLQVLAPQRLDIVDESHRHAGHAGARSGGHYALTIVSPEFAGLNTLARHRLVNATVGDPAQIGIHALSIRALTPDEV